MDLREYLSLGRKWLWLFALATAVAAVGAWIATLSMPKQYQSQSTVVVGRSTELSEPSFQDIYLSQSLATTYAQMVTREPVLARAMELAGLQGEWRNLKGMVKAAAVPGTQLVEIRVIDRDPERAKLIAAAVAEALIDKSPTPSDRDNAENRAFIQEQVDNLKASITQAEDEIKDIDAKIGLENSARAIADLQTRMAARQQQLQTWRGQFADLTNAILGSETNSIAVIEPAGLGLMVGPNARMNVLFAAALGFGLALLAVLAIEYLDDTVKTSELLEKRVGLAGLGTIEFVAGVTHRAEGLVTVNRPRSPVAEAFRVLRTNLEFMLLNQDTRKVVITSPNPGEGKSTTAANLAVAMAQGGARVVLVDTDLRRPSLHRFFGLTNSAGLTSLLLDDRLPFDSVLQAVEGVAGLRVLSSGPLPPNPAEVLKSPRTQAVLDRLADEADILVLDSPPVLVVADAAILASRADGTVLVLECGDTRIDSVRKALEVLTKVGVTPLGSVINKLEKSRVGGYYYYYQYSYRYRYGEYYGDDHRDSGDESDGHSGAAGDGGAGSDGAESGRLSTGGDGSGHHRRHHRQPATGTLGAAVERIRAGVRAMMG